MKNHSSKKAAALVCMAAALFLATALLPIIQSGGDPEDAYAHAYTIDDTLGADERVQIPVYDMSDFLRIGTGVEYPAGSGIIWSLGAWYNQVEDIYASGTANYGIGTSTEPFTGTYNGNSKKIGGIWAPLFSYTKGAKLIEIIVENAELNIEINALGGIVTTAVDTTITNCIFYGTLKPDAIGSAKAGGIAAVVSGNSIISGCKNYGNITNRAGPNNQTNTGGIVGTMTGGTISDCINYGDIEVKGGYTGGISGTSSATILRCRNEGNILATDPSANNYTGGIQGVTTGSIHNSSNHGSVNVSSAASLGTIINYAGGITGRLESFKGVQNCYNTGAIYVSGNNGAIVYAGGIIGNASNANVPAVNCYSIGTITISTTAGIYKGGIFGAPNTTAINCFALEGTATAIGGNEPEPSYYVWMPSKNGSYQVTRLASQADMQPTLADAQSGNSIYYTGSVEFYSDTYELKVFRGWDFFKIWDIDPAINGGYPTLRQDAPILPEQYFVYFWEDRGKIIDIANIEAGSTITPPPDPEMAGYLFLGWYNVPTNIGDVLTLFDFSTIITQTGINIYAGWAIDDGSVETHTVTFVVDHETSFSETIIDGGTVSKPYDPTMDGYEFLGWFAVGDTVTFDFGTPITADTTLIAGWKAEGPGIITHTVTFVIDHGTSFSETVINGGTVARPADPIRDGYDFLGWYKAGGMSEFNFAAPITADTILIAGWEASGNGGGGDGGDGTDAEVQWAAIAMIVIVSLIAGALIGTGKFAAGALIALIGYA
ncbi:MAG: InlB B-repeat-containing protein, partial [Methanomassiliicoccaceae archaeon]|nr:InlB B-repeat-containing protein [Methanomassiliicoccaceae archaeon]